MTESVNIEKKRRKLNDDKDANHSRCEFFLAKKNRGCSMQRRANQKYCSEHMIYDKEETKGERIPCPLDPKHTVNSRDLKNHLKKCNAKPKEQQHQWFEKDLNNTLKGVDDEESNIGDDEDERLTTKELYDKYIPVLQRIKFEPLKFKISKHDGLNSRLAELLNQKHAIQQSSLIGNLRDENLLSLDNFYIEFGCGKGELSRFVNLCLMEDLKGSSGELKNEKYGYGFIDRGVNRMKVDSKILKDSGESALNIRPIIKRTRIDIKDLNIDKFIEDINPNKVVGISKHLCGVATDLMLKSLLNSTLLEKNVEKFGGLLIAMCCRHVCSFKQLLPQSRAYLASNGFKTEQSFNALRKIVSWAVCGNRYYSEPETDHVTGLSIVEREKIGLIARRLIDESRVFALSQLLKGYKIEMYWYVDKEVTLENVCLCIKPLLQQTTL